MYYNITISVQIAISWKIKKYIFHFNKIEEKEVGKNNWSQRYKRDMEQTRVIEKNSKKFPHKEKKINLGRPDREI